MMDAMKAKKQTQNIEHHNCEFLMCTPDSYEKCQNKEHITPHNHAEMSKSELGVQKAV